jgi:hypothetical protein
MNTSDARPVKKAAYVKPVLTKHGNLKDITSMPAKIGSPGSRVPG